MLSLNTKFKFDIYTLWKIMKEIHQNAIKYLTYLVLNKRKLDNKQTHVPPRIASASLEPTSPKEA